MGIISCTKCGWETIYYSEKSRKASEDSAQRRRDAHLNSSDSDCTENDITYLSEDREREFSTP